MTPTKTKTKTIAIALLLAMSLSTQVGAQQEAQTLPTIQLNAGMHLIRAELAQTADQRATGLMHRKSMGANDGMLFVFEQPRQQCFWMKNTLLPLSIAFLSDDGTVVNIEDMLPQSLDSHCSKQAVRMALEMNQGWFAKRGIKTGSKLSGRAFAN